MLGALGVLPGDRAGPGLLSPEASLYGARFRPVVDKGIMANTTKKVRATWDFGSVWGWDFPMAAMAAARAGLPALALEFLLMDSPKNQYLPNGCNYQRENLPAYFPGNGGLLAAVAMMAGGWSGSVGEAPGFPKDGKWGVRCEGFREFI